MRIRSERWLTTIVALIVAAVLAACGDSSSTGSQSDGGAGDGSVGDGSKADARIYDNLPGGNPLVPELAMYPFPSDFYLKKDPSTATGYSIDIPQEALPKGLTTAMFKGMDGFSLTPMILAYFGKQGIDLKSLPDPTDPAATVAADSPVYLLEGPNWDKVAVLAELDQRPPNDTLRALILRPHRALTHGKQYVVVVRNKLKNLAGEAIKAKDAFKALRDGTPTQDPAIEKQRESFKAVNAAIKAAGLKSDEVILAWSFRARSEKQVTTPLLAMHDVMNTVALEDPKIIDDKVDSLKNRQLKATIEVPNFVPSENKPLELDKDGKPKQFGTRTIEFLMTIPENVTTPRPVIVYGHGFLGGPNQGTRGNSNSLMRMRGYSVIAAHIGMHEKLVVPLLTALTANLPNIDYVVAEVLQSIANQTLLARLVKEKLATGQFKQYFDPTKVHYFGISNGGTFGMLTTATSPQFERGVLSVGGGGLVHFLQRATQWNEYGPLVDKIYRNPMLQQLLFSLVQHNLDPIDNMSYMHRLVHDRFPGRKPFKALIVEAVGDSQVRNILTEWAARTARVKLLSPSAKPLYGFETVTAAPPDGAPASTKGALIVFDEKVTPSPVTNLPPAKDNGTHGSVHKLPAFHRAFWEFLENGKFVQDCNGGCDPD